MNNSNKIINKKKQLKVSLKKNFKGIINLLPIILSVILLISIINALFSNDIYSKILVGNQFIDALILNSIGSFLAGNPITAYVISGELLKNKISLFVITTFILSWTTVGIIQLPAESILMGKKFAIIRNITAFIFALIVSYITILIYGVIFL